MLLPLRWRALRADDDLLAQLREHLEADSVRSFAVNHIKTCYFILRAVGDTGLEGFLDSFFDWSERIFGVAATDLMPTLYQRSMSDPASMDAILDNMYDVHYAQAGCALLADLPDEKIIQACLEAKEFFVRDDVDMVVAGHYDLGGIVMSRLLEFHYPSPAMLFRIHRIS